ncbi:unnamed protein product [Linum tenue]|uniref:Uncharacterized protein n=1 Tax=Linum tenue TaxID=586396 RepID=A0AAV0M8L0_9ROSI|nr:unnamed protein product [Linum tenue]
MKLEWIGDGSMVRSENSNRGPNPAIKHDRTRNRKVWFNGMVAGYTAFGDKRNDPTKSVAFGNGDCLNLTECRSEVLVRVWVKKKHERRFD